MHVIETAMNAYWQDDRAAVSINTICTLAEVSKPSLYREFGSEDGLTIAVLERYAETVLVSMDATLSGPMSYSAKLDAIIGFVSEAPILESGCLYVKMRATRSRFGPQTQECIAAIESHILEKYAQFFGEAIRSGEWGNEITAELAADYMHEQISLAASQRAAGKNSASVRRLLELAICILR
jgi:AcrR family transcriptional regulator